MDTDTAERIERAIREDGRYPPAAYEFLHRALEHTTRSVHGVNPSERPSHVTGQQLCHGARALALANWGSMAPAVLNSWRIRSTRDFGEMVFLLIELGLMGRQDSDRIEDFDEVYDFQQAFGSHQIPVDEFDEQD